MAITSVRHYLKVYSFLVRVEGLRASGFYEARWEGSCLILARGICTDEPAPPLFAAFIDGKPKVTIELLTRDGEPSGYAWEVTYARALDRGFINLDAKREDIACEAVCLVDAETVRIRS